MDFETHYTEEQEQFRKEVHAWFEANVPLEMRVPLDRNPAYASEELYQFWLRTGRALGAKGWLFPTYPKEYGGGGLTAAHETILQEEFQRVGVPHLGSNLAIPPLLVWGTEEQKQKFLKPMLTLERLAWQKFTEPKGGADLASYKSKAVRDGDEWVLNGSTVFAGGHETEPSWYYGPMVTDPKAPRHRNLGFFMVPFPHPGVSIQWMSLVEPDKFNRKVFFFMDDVRVPADHLIGDEHNGWQVTNTTLEFEHGGRGQAFPKDETVESMVSYLAQNRQQGKHPGGDPVVQQTAMTAYVESRIQDLISKRTYWMYMNRKPMNWEGPANAWVGKEIQLRHAWRARNIMGMHTLLGTHDPLAPHGGRQEVFQRTVFVNQHGAGSLNIAKVILARRIGISRTQERAAPTPGTATKHAA